MDVTDFPKVTADDGHFLPDAFRHPAQHQAFPRIVQYRPRPAPHFLQNPVGQPSEAQNIDIHYPLFRVRLHQIHLCLHRKLVRYNHQKIRSRIGNGTVHDFPVELRALAGTGSAEIKS